MKNFSKLLLFSLIAIAAIAIAEPTALHSLSSIGPDAYTLSIMGGAMTVQQLENEAGKLSYFEGGKAMQFYTGFDDDFLSFEGDIRSFAQELDKNLDKQFTVSIVNANAASRVTLLYAGYFLGDATNKPGQLVEGAYNDVNAAAGLTGATTESRPIKELHLYLNAVPTRLLALKIQSTVAGQLNSNLEYQRFNPFKTEETKIIRPKNFINQDTYQNDQVTFPVDVQLDQAAQLKYTIAGSSTNYVTFYFGAGLNVMEALEKKAMKAGINISAVGKENIIRTARAQRAIG
ncbi:MAG: hypothetical protein WAU36_12030 [Cyclobacteriaceae bacterium]